MTKFTKERLEEIAELARKATYKPCSMHMTNLLVVCDSEVIEEMARQLLASMEQEPVACIDRANLDYLESGADADVWPASGAGSDDVLLYAAPQLPQPAVLSVSEGVLKSLLPDVEKSEFWFEHNGKIFFEGVRFNNAVFEACRAAMLQAEPVKTANKLPFEQWLSQQTGTIDVECGCVMTEVFFHWLRVAYETGNSPVIPDGWVMVPIEPTAEMISSGIAAHFERSQTQIHDRPAPGPMECAYVAMLAAAPQQEVKNV
ncbi:hypothetical protein [Citrobacter freundii]|uniref:hypothetical protein n=1 Tax=Citrobacter freundii TaxID=546 RepID=UPI001C703999|nr:hypothetical protein [Citrobacter freundii]